MNKFSNFIFNNLFLFFLFSALLGMYEWLVCYLLELTENKLAFLKTQNLDTFTAKNETQVFYAKPLSLAFIEVCNVHYDFFI